MLAWLREFWLFGIKQASACLFGGYLLGLMLLTAWWYPFESWIYRYDFLFVAAVLFQLGLLLFRLETPREALAILVFHVVATAMEWFKTSDAIVSWHYPEKFQVGIGNVPLFAGFMYSAVGSYIARIWRIFQFEFAGYPGKGYTVLLVLAIYFNFFTHHYVWDLRWMLLALTLALFGRTWIYFKVDQIHRRMPFLLGCFMVALFIWLGENVGTYTRIWLYPSQQLHWHPVAFSKLIAWFLLMLLSFVLVSLLHAQPENRQD